MAKSKCTGCKHWTWLRVGEWARLFGETGFHYCDIHGLNRSLCDKFNETTK